MLRLHSRATPSELPIYSICFQLPIHVLRNVTGKPVQIDSSLGPVVLSKLNFLIVLTRIS